jgi:hypothetical protein
VLYSSADALPSEEQKKEENRDLLFSGAGAGTEITEN